MPDPRLELTAQELFYAATALRAEARRSSQRGNEPQYGSTQEVFRKAARGTEALAEDPAHRGTGRTPFGSMNRRTRTLCPHHHGAGHDDGPRLTASISGP